MFQLNLSFDFASFDNDAASTSLDANNSNESVNKDDQFKEIGPQNLSHLEKNTEEEIPVVALDIEIPNVKYNFFILIHY